MPTLSSSVPGAAAALVAALLLAGCASDAPAPSARAGARASAPAPVATAPARLPATNAEAIADARGWGWLVDRLAHDGLARERAARAFADPRVPAFDGLYFSPDPPRESHYSYRKFLRASSVAGAQRCAAANADSLARAERVHGVDAGVIAAILHVETHCGANTGRSIVLHRLARLAMANEPANLQRNLRRWTDRKTGKIDALLDLKVRERARYLDDIFYPQVLATFEVARQAGVDPVSLRGSGAGAFGYPQFLPLNFLAFGIDANGDGRVSLYDPEDAAASCARFLASHGWKPGIAVAKQREIIWHYNRSTAYIDTVLGLARRVDASGVIEAAAAASVAGAVVESALPGPSSAH